ncbi:Uncharacterised protein [Enterobacter hormaechei]|nr:Uncharacterised protein [Enterobacter hormaechei]VAF66202.1 Uncharacterised protein [Enterobacter hormaechei]
MDLVATCGMGEGFLMRVSFSSQAYKGMFIC